MSDEFKKCTVFFMNNTSLGDHEVEISYDDAVDYLEEITDHTEEELREMSIIEFESLVDKHNDAIFNVMYERGDYCVQEMYID